MSTERYMDYTANVVRAHAKEQPLGEPYRWVNSIDDFDHLSNQEYALALMTERMLKEYVYEDGDITNVQVTYHRPHQSYRPTSALFITLDGYILDSGVTHI